MLKFFKKKILPFLTFASPKIIKKILDVALSKFVKIYEDDINFSIYTINGILDEILNLLLITNDSTILLHTINLCEKKNITL